MVQSKRADSFKMCNRDILFQQGETEIFLIVYLSFVVEASVGCEIVQH
jgi:hypothetical protein